MYRAPEQGGCVAGSPKFHPSSPIAGNSYNEKADMFSMGVILFEMCHPPFVTGTERIFTLQVRDIKQLIFTFLWQRKN